MVKPKISIIPKFWLELCISQDIAFSVLFCCNKVSGYIYNESASVSHI